MSPVRSLTATAGSELPRKETSHIILEHLQLLVDLEHTMVKGINTIPALQLALAQLNVIVTTPDVIVLYIVPERTNHHLEDYREELAPCSIGIPSALKIH